MTRLTVLTGSSYTDAGLINGFPLYYTIQAIGANAACDGNLSSCVAVTPQSNSGVIKLDASSYTCTGQVNATVTDANIGADTTTIALSSPTETATETMTLTRITPGSATYAGSMTLTRNAPVHNGVLSVGNGDLITARYIDANDGAGHMNLQRVATASVTCAAPPSVKPVPDGTFGTAMTSARADGSTGGFGKIPIPGVPAYASKIARLIGRHDRPDLGREHLRLSRPPSSLWRPRRRGLADRHGVGVRPRGDGNRDLVRRSRERSLVRRRRRRQRVHRGELGYGQPRRPGGRRDGFGAMQPLRQGQLRSLPVVRTAPSVKIELPLGAGSR